MNVLLDAYLDIYLSQSFYGISVTEYGLDLKAVSQAHLLYLNRVQNEAMRLSESPAYKNQRHEPLKPFRPARPSTNANQTKMYILLFTHVSLVSLSLSASLSPPSLCSEMCVTS